MMKLWWKGPICMTEKLSSELEQRFRDLEENYKRIRFELEEAAAASGRSPEEVTLLAATKTVPVEVVNRGIELGIRHIGENRVQELCEKYDRYAPVDLQFIGHLQTNKVRQIIEKVSMIQSVDSAHLAQEISRQAGKAGREMDVLIEVNIGREENKSGVLPEALPELLGEVAAMPRLHIRGLMAIPPADAGKEETIRFFSRMTQYFIDIKQKRIDNVTMDYLSMGMSADFADAVRAGANLVRIGSALFGPRVYR